MCPRGPPGRRDTRSFNPLFLFKMRMAPRLLYLESVRGKRRCNGGFGTSQSCYGKAATGDCHQPAPKPASCNLAVATQISHPKAATLTRDGIFRPGSCFSGPPNKRRGSFREEATPFDIYF
jgi:hypothetical protein